MGRRSAVTSTRVITLLAAMTMALALCASTVATAADDLEAKQSLEQVRQRGERGDLNAQFVLGWMYEDGTLRGVPQDYVEAAKWYRMAADQGYYAAMHELGVMYTEGRGVPQDYVMAYMWLNLAAARSPPAEPNAAEARDFVARKMTATQIAE